jgi:DNA-binding NarL/FixJ family response regulator
MLALGLSNKVIAQRLKISSGTVKNQTHSIYQKLNVRNRTEAVLAGIKKGIIEI